MVTRPKVAMMIITDGREGLLDQTWESWQNEMVGYVFYQFIVDDSADKEYNKYVKERYGPLVNAVHCHETRLGFGETIRDAWSHIPEGIDYILHLEDDFTLNRVLYLDNWVDVLEKNPNVVQIVAYRQPWNAEEIAAGGFIQLYRDQYRDAIYSGISGKYAVVEHRRNFSTNPTVYPRWVSQIPWPESPYSEGKFGFVLRELKPDPVYLIWGWSEDPPLVNHIGNQRKGEGY